MGLCVSKIFIVISQQCLLWSNDTFTFVLPHYIEYHASNRPTEHDSLPVLIQYIDHICMVISSNLSGNAACNFYFTFVTITFSEGKPVSSETNESLFHKRIRPYIFSILPKCTPSQSESS